MKAGACVAVVAAVLAGLAGCSNQVDVRTAHGYAHAGYQAIQASEWKLARQNFDKAIANAEAGKARPRQLAVLKYEYGRVSGVLCDWDGAERALTEASVLDKGKGGTAMGALHELGRLHLDRGRFVEARPYYDKVLPLFKAAEAETKDPSRFADFLEEYAVVLSRTGAASDAALQSERVSKIRKTISSGTARQERTPYGTRCL